MAVKSIEEDMADSEGLASFGTNGSLGGPSDAREGGSSEASRLRISFKGSSMPFALRLAMEVRRLEESTR